MDIELAVKALTRARLETKDATLHEAWKALIWMAHELSIARSEIALLTMRVEELEPPASGKPFES